MRGSNCDDLKLVWAMAQNCEVRHHTLRDPGIARLNHGSSKLWLLHVTSGLTGPCDASLLHLEVYCSALAPNPRATATHCAQCRSAEGWAFAGIPLGIHCCVFGKRIGSHEGLKRWHRASPPHWHLAPDSNALLTCETWPDRKVLMDAYGMTCSRLYSSRSCLILWDLFEASCLSLWFSLSTAARSHIEVFPFV